MKRIIGTLAVCGLLIGAAMVLTAQPALPLRAEIPFGFYVGDTWVPPGEYDVAKFTTNVVRVNRTDGRESVLRVVNPTITPRETKTNALVFRRYGANRYFLGEILVTGGGVGAYLPESRREKEAVEAVLLTGNKPTEVVILAYVRK